VVCDVCVGVWCVCDVCMVWCVCVVCVWLVCVCVVCGCVCVCVCGPREFFQLMLLMLRHETKRPGFW